MKTYDTLREEMAAIKSASNRKISLMEDLKREKERENDMNIILVDTFVMSQAQKRDSC